MAQNLEATVGLEVEADNFLKELRDIFVQASNLIDSNLGGPGNSSKQSKPENDESVSMMGNMFKSLKGILGFAGKIFAGVSVMAVLMKVFEPVVNIINSAVKLVSELLRPVSDMLMLLLQPLLQLLKPIVMTMRVLMAPFKKAAQQMALAGQKAFQAGETGAGMEMLMASVGTMLGPFITIIVGEGLKLASNVLLSALEFMLLQILGIFAPIINKFGGDAEGLAENIRSGFNIARDSINDAITGLQLKVLSGMAEAVNDKIDDFKEKYPDFTGGLEKITTDFTSMSLINQVLDNNLGEVNGQFGNINNSGRTLVGTLNKVKTAIDSINKQKPTKLEKELNMSLPASERYKTRRRYEEDSQRLCLARGSSY